MSSVDKKEDTGGDDGKKKVPVSTPTTSSSSSSSSKSKSKTKGSKGKGKSKSNDKPDVTLEAHLQQQRQALTIATQVVDRVVEQFGKDSKNLCIPLQRMALLQNENGFRKEAAETATRCSMLAQIVEDPLFLAQSYTLMAIFALEQFEYVAADEAATLSIVLIGEIPKDKRDESLDTMEVQSLNVLG